jgi:cyclopropane fatty-acyl-phospholipid synthase-like methyltransferase
MSDPSDLGDPKEIVERGYDTVAADYARLEEGAGWPRMRWLKKVLQELDPGSSVLDLGCGSGDPADVAIARAYQVTGVDLSGEQIARARKNAPSGRYIHGDAAAVEFPAASFDAVVSFYTLEHIPRAEHAALLRRMGQWLRPGGLLLISMEAGEAEGMVGEWLGVPMYFSCFGPEETVEMIREAGFEIVETAIEPQVEQGVEIPYHWVLGRKP